MCVVPEPSPKESRDEVVWVALNRPDGVRIRDIADEVRTADHPDVSDRVVWRICRDHQWWSVFGTPKRAKASKPGAPSHVDLVRQNFNAKSDGMSASTAWVGIIGWFRAGQTGTRPQGA